MADLELARYEHKVYGYARVVVEIGGRAVTAELRGTELVTDVDVTPAERQEIIAMMQAYSRADDHALREIVNSQFEEKP
jgi:hypothetical protein